MEERSNGAGLVHPTLLDPAAAHEWRVLAGQVRRARLEGWASRTNPSLQAAVDRAPQSPAAPAFLLWAADNLGHDKRYDEALAVYDSAIESVAGAPPLIAGHKAAAGAMFHKAQVAALAGARRSAITAWRDLAALDPSDPEPLLEAGSLAEADGDAALAAELYRERAAEAFSRHSEDCAQLARRAYARLQSPASAFEADARRVADLLLDALERRDAERLRALASPTHFAVGPTGGHAEFESEEVLEHLLRELKDSNIVARRELGGCGDKRHLQTSGWRGRWYRGDLMFLITRAPRGWQWTGLGIPAPGDLWAERWRPAEKMTNAPLPFELLAPWPEGQCFRAGGVFAHDYALQNAQIAAAIASGSLLGPLGAIFGTAAAFAIAVSFAASRCGFGKRGFYYNDTSTHENANAFAIDFMRCRRYVPYINASEGTPVLAAREGTVHTVRAFGSTGGSTLNRVEIVHADPGDPSDQTRFRTRYLHLQGPMIDAPSEMMPVVAGNRIGRMDDTGNSFWSHLHFSIHDKRIDHPDDTERGASVRPSPMSGVTLGDEDGGRCVCSTNFEIVGDEPMVEVKSFAGQNWLITPAANAVGQPPPSSIGQQRFLLVLTGVAVIDYKGNSESSWRHDTVALRPELTGPLMHAANTHGLPKPPGTVGAQFVANFRVEQWAPFAALSSIYNQDESNDSGFAVNVWRPNPFIGVRDIFTNDLVDNVFDGIQVDIAARDTDAFILRLSYHIALLGRIVFSPILFT